MSTQARDASSAVAADARLFLKEVDTLRDLDVEELALLVLHVQTRYFQRKHRRYAPMMEAIANEAFAYDQNDWEDLLVHLRLLRRSSSKAFESETLALADRALLSLACGRDGFWQGAGGDYFRGLTEHIRRQHPDDADELLRYLRQAVVRFRDRTPT